MVRLHFNAWYALCLVLLGVLAAETTTRIEDRLRYGTELLHTPDFDHDLFEPLGNGDRKGKPHGHYKKWRLNQFGCRSPEVEIKRSAGRTRVMLVGSSETFGVFESPGKDYPAQLLSVLNRSGDYEVINTALPGMTLRSATRAFDDRFAAFSPDVVVIYVSPLFYLNMSPKQNSTKAKPTAMTRTAANKQLTPPFRPRVMIKLFDTLAKPDLWQRRIDAKELAVRREALGLNQATPDRTIGGEKTKLLLKSGVIASSRALTTDMQKGVSSEPVEDTEARSQRTPASVKDYTKEARRKQATHR